MSDWKSCDNCSAAGCSNGDKMYCTANNAFRWWKPIPCKYCGGALSEIRERKDKNGKVIKRYRHCYSCHFEFEEA